MSTTSNILWPPFATEVLLNWSRLDQNPVLQPGDMWLLFLNQDWLQGRRQPLSWSTSWWRSSAATVFLWRPAGGDTGCRTSSLSDPQSNQTLMTVHNFENNMRTGGWAVPACHLHPSCEVYTQWTDNLHTRCVAGKENKQACRVCGREKYHWFGKNGCAGWNKDPIKTP